ncbi:MAG TPA: fused response regulator/phosphatase [Jatrophihabitans sp.]|nr:fused response regulator/phosphatase [Jatrophihabitans sp.]
MSVPTTPATVLVVDDAPGSRLVFTKWLGRAGYRVLEATTGEQALDLLSRVKTDLVVLDVNLPDMSGLDVCDQIKGSRATASIPVLHVSATATAPDDRSQALNRGADGYLIEPIERDELLATVTSLLRYHEARRVAERLASRLERLHQATLLMSASPTVTELMQFACTGLASVFGSAVAVLLIRDGAGRVAVGSPNLLDPEFGECTAEQVRAAAAAVRSGSVADPSAFGVPLAGPAHGSVVATPQGEPVGVLLLAAPGSPEDDLMLDHFAQAAAVTLENQRLYAVEHKIALTLQRAMLPASVPQPEHVEIAVQYQAVGDSVEIGGDFYEAIALDDEVTLVAVGDVVGHSLRAATVMAELRHSLRAFASVRMPAEEIMGRLNAILLESHPGLTATLCIAEIHRSGELRVVNAGHILPLLRDHRGTSYVAGHGPLLGLRTSKPVPVVTETFGPGSVLVLVTDGLLERRYEDLEIGLDRLRATVAGDAAADPAELCERILAEVGAGEDTFDDIAIVVARGRPA